MFTPSRDQVRQFFIDAWRKHQNHQLLTPLEMMAVDIVVIHPEYHALLNDPGALERDFLPEDGNINPFLHLSLHLAIAEQLSIDQPPGIRAAVALVEQRRQDRHAALHDALECLGEMLWHAQRNQQPPDGARYLSSLRRCGGVGE